MQRRAALSLNEYTPPVSTPSTEGLVDSLMKLITGAPEHQSAAERRKLNDASSTVINQIKNTYLNDQWWVGKEEVKGELPAKEIRDYTWYAKSEDPVACVQYLVKSLRQFIPQFSKTMTPFANAVGKQTIRVRNSQEQFANQTFDTIYPTVMAIPMPKLDGPVVLGGYAYKEVSDDFEASERWLRNHSNQVQVPPKKDTIPTLTKDQVKNVAQGIVNLLEEGQKFGGVIYNSTPFVDTDDDGWASEAVHMNGKLKPFIRHVDGPTAKGEWYCGMTVLSAIAFEKWCSRSVK